MQSLGLFQIVLFDLIDLYEIGAKLQSLNRLLSHQARFIRAQKRLVLLLTWHSFPFSLSLFCLHFSPFILFTFLKVYVTNQPNRKLLFSNHVCKVWVGKKMCSTTQKVGLVKVGRRLISIFFYQVWLFFKVELRRTVKL